MYAYVDFNEKQLFRGTINHPVDIHSQEFLIEQVNKTVAFQNVFEKSVTSNTAKERVSNMIKSFVKRGRRKQNFRTYQKLDKQIKELSNSTTALSKRAAALNVDLANFDTLS